MLAVVVKETNGKEHRMIRGKGNFYYFITNLMLCKDYDVPAKEFIDLWDSIGPITKDLAGLHPIMEGLVVVDLKERVIYSNIKNEELHIFLLPIKSDIKSDMEELAKRFDCRIYSYNIAGFIEMKEDLEKSGFKFTDKEEESWDDFLVHFEGNNHIKVENA